ncbi:MAG: hypothetical protein ABI359_03000 [Ginsengibacter sp.]
MKSIFFLITFLRYSHAITMQPTAEPIKAALATVNDNNIAETIKEIKKRIRIYFLRGDLIIKPANNNGITLAR